MMTFGEPTNIATAPPPAAATSSTKAPILTYLSVDFGKMSAIEIETNDYTNVPSGQTINFSNTYRCDSAIHERILVRREGERHVICTAGHVLALLWLAISAPACAFKRAVIPPPVPDRTGQYIDLHARWRMEVVTP